MSNQEVLTKSEVEGLLAKQNERFEKRLADVANKSGFKTSAVVYNPATKINYEDDGVSIPPKYEVPIMDHEKWMSIYMPNEEQKKALAGSSDKDREEDCYFGDYLGKYQEMKSKLNDAYNSKNFALAGAVITSNDFTGLTTNLNISRLTGFQLVNNVLEQAVTVQQAPNLKATYRNWVGFEVMPNVPEGVIVEAKKGALSETSFVIKKDVGAAAITIEGELTIDLSIQDIFGDHIRWIAKKLRKLRNTKIATAINAGAFAATQAAIGVWDTYTAGISNNDPTLDFLITIQTLAANGYSLNTIASNSKPKNRYFANTWIKGINQASPAAQRFPNVAASVAGIDSAPTWYADNDLTTTTIAFAYDKEVVVTFEGPKRQVEIQRPDAEVREYYSRDFNSTFIVDSNGIVKLTTLNGA